MKNKRTQAKKAKDVDFSWRILIEKKIYYYFFKYLNFNVYIEYFKGEKTLEFSALIYYFFFIIKKITILLYIYISYTKCVYYLKTCFFCFLKWIELNSYDGNNHF